jgi:hypothetical protein
MGPLEGIALDPALDRADSRVGGAPGGGYTARKERLVIVNRGIVKALRGADLELLEEILASDATSPAVKIQAIQTREKILGAIEEALPPEEERAIDKILEALEE